MKYEPELIGFKMSRRGTELVSDEVLEMLYYEMRWDEHSATNWWHIGAGLLVIILQIAAGPAGLTSLACQCVRLSTSKREPALSWSPSAAHVWAPLIFTCVNFDLCRGLHACRRVRRVNWIELHCIAGLGACMYWSMQRSTGSWFRIRSKGRPCFFFFFLLQWKKKYRDSTCGNNSAKN